MDRGVLHIFLFWVLIVTGLMGCVHNSEDVALELNGETNISEKGEDRAKGSRSIKSAAVFGGKVSFVQESLGFVLIKASAIKPSSGIQLIVYREGGKEPVAQLSVSPERRAGFIVADIVSGQPKKDDWVLFTRTSSVRNLKKDTPSREALTMLKIPVLGEVNAIGNSVEGELDLKGTKFDSAKGKDD